MGAPSDQEAVLSGSAWARARSDAASVYRSPAFAIGTLLLDAVVGAVAAIFVAAPNTPTGEVVAAAVLATAVGTIFAVLSVFAIQAVAAPVRQRNELRQEAHRALRAAPSAEEVAATERRKMREGALRVAVAQISEELELHASVLDQDDRSFFAEHQLAVPRWTEHGQALADHGHLEAHRTVRHAYRLIDDVNRSIERQYGVLSDVVQVIGLTIDEQGASEALSACRRALEALNRVEQG